MRSTVGRVVKVAEEARRRAAILVTIVLVAVAITVAVAVAYWVSQVSV